MENDISNFNEEPNNVSTVSQFKWKSTIKRKLKDMEDSNGITLKKLKTYVLEEYKKTLETPVDDISLNTLFYQKLESAGVRIAN